MLIRDMEFNFRDQTQPTGSLLLWMEAVVSWHLLLKFLVILFAAPLEIINLTVDETPSNSQRALVFVGVMTSKDFLESRAKAVHNTWGKLVSGRIAFFSSEGSSCDGKQR